eukprot:4836_1
MYAYNTTPNNMTTFAPSQIIFGLNPCYNNTPDINEIPLTNKLSREYINFITNRINIIRNKANIQQDKYDIIRKRSYDKRSSDQNYEIGYNNIRGTLQTITCFYANRDNGTETH